MKKVLIVTDCSFPGSAMASRILSFSSLFKDIDYDVHIISAKTDDENIKQDVVIKKDNYSFEIVSSKRSYRTQSFLGNENLKSVVEKYLSNKDIDLVFATSLGFNYKQIYKLCKQYNVKFLLEQCEWFDYSSFGLKRLDPRFVRFTYNIKNRFVKADGVISITRLLNDYYESRNVKTIRIPSILDLKKKPFNNDLDNKKINLVYTGNTSKSKELLKPILKVLSSKDVYKDRIVFNIYGSNENDVLNNIDNDLDLYNRVKDLINIYGKVAQNEIENILLKSDYQIFIRPYRRSSNAGFPTKLAESMSVGTPVITNNTGDICLYLKDGFNGFVCNDNSSEAISKVFDKIITISKTNYSKLRKNARNTAEDNFDYRKYKELLKDFIENI